MTASAEPRTPQKDPQKVAVGWAGAAARKAKHEKLLAQLREVKDVIREPVIDGVSKATDIGGVSATHAFSASPHVVDTTGHLESVGAATRKAGTMTDWTPWVAGGVGLASFAWFLHERSRTVASQLPQPKPTRPATLTPSITAKSQTVKPTISASLVKQLRHQTHSIWNSDHDYANY